MTTKTLNPTVVQTLPAVKSTPVADRTPVRGEGSELKNAVEALKIESAAFGQQFIQDSAVRADYQTKVNGAINEILDQVRARKITPHQGAQMANAMRNQLMELSRAKLTDFGLALSRNMKERGKQMAELEVRYANELFKRDFAKLGYAEKQAVWRRIIERAGKANDKVNMIGRVGGIAGRVLMITSLAIAVHAVVNAEDKPREAVKQGVGIGAGIAGGAAGGAVVVALASNPAGWAVTAGVLVGACVMGVSATEAFDYFWPGK